MNEFPATTNDELKQMLTAMSQGKKTASSLNIA